LNVVTDAGVIDRLSAVTGKLIKGLRPSDVPDSYEINGFDQSRISFDVGENTSGLSESGSAQQANVKTGRSEQTVTDWFKVIQSKDHSQHPINVSTLGKTPFPSLPKALTLHDTLRLLPRLSPIPLPSKAGPGMMQPVLKKSIKDVHLITNKSTSAALSSFDISYISYSNSCVLGTIGGLSSHLYSSSSLGEDSDRTRHCTDAVFGMHAIAYGTPLLASSKGDTIALITNLRIHLYQIPLTIRPSIHSPIILRNVELLSSYKLYLEQCIHTILLDYATLSALPSRLTMNVKESLEEQEEGPLQQHLAQLLLTGHCSKTVIEWLRDELTDRGQKRWDHAMTTLYNSIRTLYEINLIPAIERIVITATTLRGIAKYYDGSSKFDVAPQLFTAIIDASSYFLISAHEALQIIGEEEVQFRAFSQWLKLQVNLAMTETGSTVASELAEKLATTSDVSRILTFIEGPLVSSRLLPFLSKDFCYPESIPSAEEFTLTLKNLSEALESNRTSSVSHNGLRILSLNFQMEKYDEEYQMLLNQLQRWSSTTWLPPREISLQINELSLGFDLKCMYCEMNGINPGFFTIAGIAGRSSNEISIARIRSSLDDDSPVKYSSIILPLQCVITHIRLLGNDSILALIDESEKAMLTRLVCLPINDSRDSVVFEDLERYCLHSFVQAEDTFRPSQIYCTEKDAKGNVALLDKNRQKWRIYKLPCDIEGEDNTRIPDVLQHEYSEESDW